MNNHRNKRAGGYVSFVMVLSLGITVLAMLIMVYKTSIRALDAQGQTSLRIDYAQKEEAVLRAIIPIAANRAMGCMQSGSDASDASRVPLSWQKIFRAAIVQANAEASVDAAMLRRFGLDDALLSNPGDNTTWASETFNALDSTQRYTTPGLNRDLGPGFPVPLQTSSTLIPDRDHHWPIISTEKAYGSLAADRVGASPDDYPDFTLLPYPEIRFGYAKPGDAFVAKRNWWGFAMDLADQWDENTGAAQLDREFILSIYEVPSQLAISAEAFTVLGKHADGTDWQNATIEGGVFATRARVESGFNLSRLSGRRGVELSADATIGEMESSETDSGTVTQGMNPFAPGVREQYEITNGSYMPLSLASESGRAAFIPINRGIEFFDRFAHQPESQTISPTTWNNYTVGALQCAMWLDVTDVPSENDPTPSELRFSYLKGGVRQTMTIDLLEGPDAGLPPGYIYCGNEHDTVVFTETVDVAYGINGSYYFEEDVTGSVTFENERFGDPYVGTLKAGYYRPSYPFEIRKLHDSKLCVVVQPELMPAFLASIGADGPEVNHSITVNVDYPGCAYLERPSIPCTELDYGVILEKCADLTPFTKGFSVVTNLRLYIGDDFNVVETTPPVGSGLPTPFYPACSLFAPEKRYGAEIDPFRLRISGSLGSLAGDSGSAGDTVHLLDMKNSRETELAHDRLEVNLAPIRHPAALPPIKMMNWLIVVEERRREFREGSQAQLAQ